jgi:hypothetical protein
MVNPTAIVYDPTNDNLIVANQGIGTFGGFAPIDVETYPRGATGVVAPLYTISGIGYSSYGAVVGLGYDDANQTIYLSTNIDSVGPKLMAFPRAQNNAAAPMRTIPMSEMAAGAAFNSHTQEIAVAQQLKGSVSFWQSTDTGPVPPERKIQAPLGGVTSVAVDDAHGEVFVADQTLGAVLVYPRLASGYGTLPRRILVDGSNIAPVAVFYDPVKDQLVVINPNSAATYPPSRGSSGLVNVTAIGAASGASLGYSNAMSAAFDSTTREVAIAAGDVVIIDVDTGAHKRTLLGAMSTGTFILDAVAIDSVHDFLYVGRATDGLCDVYQFPLGPTGWTGSNGQPDPIWTDYIPYNLSVTGLSLDQTNNDLYAVVGGGPWIYNPAYNPTAPTGPPGVSGYLGGSISAVYGITVDPTNSEVVTAGTHAVCSYPLGRPGGNTTPPSRCVVTGMAQPMGMSVAP